MPRLEDLRQSLQDMSPEELRARIKTIREDRILRKVQPKAKVEKAKRKSAVHTALASLSPEELEALMKEMEQ